MRDDRLALLWHGIEFVVVMVLAALSVVGLRWSWQHQRPRLVETRPRP